MNNCREHHEISLRFVEFNQVLPNPWHKNPIEFHRTSEIFEM